MRKILPNQILLNTEAHIGEKKVLGEFPTKDDSPPDENKSQPLSTGTTISRTIPHKDNSPS